MTPCMEIILSLVPGLDSGIGTQQTFGTSPRVTQNLIQPDSGWAGRPGGFGGGPAPDPIPNSAVKTPSAHGTVSQGTGE